MRPFPRATSDQVVLSAEVWNRLAETVEYLARLSVSAPLELSDAAGGRALAIRPAPPDSVVVKITAAATGGGFYNGRILTGRADADGSANLDMPEGMTVPDSDDALILNLAENGWATHLLSPGNFYNGLVIGLRSDGKRLVAITPNDGLFAVAVTRVGGADGSNSAYATWTYDVKTIDSVVTLASAVTVQKSRLLMCSMQTGTVGVAYYNGATLVLWDVNEQMNQTNC